MVQLYQVFQSNVNIFYGFIYPYIIQLGIWFLVIIST